jgi:hypothetical protein
MAEPMAANIAVPNEAQRIALPKKKKLPNA